MTQSHDLAPSAAPPRPVEMVRIEIPPFDLPASLFPDTDANTAQGDGALTFLWALSQAFGHLMNTIDWQTYPQRSRLASPPLYHVLGQLDMTLEKHVGAAPCDGAEGARTKLRVLQYRLENFKTEADDPALVTALDALERAASEPEGSA